MSWTRNLFGRGGPFSRFSDDEKRALLELDEAYLRVECQRRFGGGGIFIAEMTEARFLVLRLSDGELNQLVEICRLKKKTRATSGPKAIALCRQVAHLAPWDENCLTSIGSECARACDSAKAVRWFERALALNPANDSARANLEKARASDDSK